MPFLMQYFCDFITFIEFLQMLKTTRVSVWEHQISDFDVHDCVGQMINPTGTICLLLLQVCLSLNIKKITLLKFIHNTILILHMQFPAKIYLTSAISCQK